MIHEFWGLKPEIIGKADPLAKEGYIVVAPDLMRGSSTSSLLRAIFQVATTPMPQIDGDLDAVFTWLTTQSDVKAKQIAVMGFCFGGGASLRYSVNTGKPAATIVFYGTPISDPTRLKNLSGPVLGVFGETDTSIPVANVKAMEAGLNDAGVKHEISIYPEQGHAFVTSIEAINAGGPQQQAWNQLLAFLKQSLQAGGAPTHKAVALSGRDAVDWGYIARLAWSHATMQAHQHQ
jgi:carboxymethylenebutenolidase